MMEEVDSGSFFPASRSRMRSPSASTPVEFFFGLRRFNVGRLFFPTLAFLNVFLTMNMQSEWIG